MKKTKRKTALLMSHTWGGKLALRGARNLQCKALQVVRITFSTFLKLLKPSIKYIHRHNQLTPINPTKRLHKIEQILANFHSQSLNFLVCCHIKRRQCGQILHRNPNFGRKRRRISRQKLLSCEGPYIARETPQCFILKVGG